MDTKPSSPQKVRVTLSITKEAQDIMLDNGYASVRGMGEFLSRLVMDYHSRASRVQQVPTTHQEIAQEMRRLADIMESIG